MRTLRHGVEVTGEGVVYRWWSPSASKASVLIFNDPAATRTARVVPLAGLRDGWFEATDYYGKNGDYYKFEADGSKRVPDVASRCQPHGVHGPSQVFKSAYQWQAAVWKRPSVDDLVIYELHVGTWTPAGTFRSAIARLDHLKKLGVTAIELMPVNTFPGARNWGYDTVFPFAPCAAYGPPDDLRALIDHAHQRGLAVILDVVYNHVCADPNWLAATDPAYFKEREGNPWGAYFNFDGPHRDAVRAYFLQNAAWWLDEFRVDGLRLDATHAIKDGSPVHLLQEISDLVHSRGAFVIAEDDRNDARALCSTGTGGMGMDAMWADDFHHSVKMLLRREPVGYYRSYRGTTDELRDTLQHGWKFRGQVFPLTQKPRGTECENQPPQQFVHCISNHDQVGNRPLGERLNHLVSPAAYRAASMLLCLSPYSPLLFMGQEWAATTPFCFFTDHHGFLGRGIREGRFQEFAHFESHWPAEMLARMPDPQDEDTYWESKLNWAEVTKSPHQQVLGLYQECLERRREVVALRLRDRSEWRVFCEHDALVIHYGVAAPSPCLLVVNFAEKKQGDVSGVGVTSRFSQLLSSNERRFGGYEECRFDPATGKFFFSGPGALLLGGGE